MNVRDIKRRIRSIENTRQITRAMEMVAGTKMRKAQAAALRSRDYAVKANDLLAAVAGEADTHRQPLLERRPVKRTGFVVMGSDRGLCGSMNTNVLRAALAEAGKSGGTAFVAIGRKAEQGLRHRSLTASFQDLSDQSRYEEIVPVGETLVDEFEQGRVDRVVLVYPEFVSTLVNRPKFETLLPAELPEDRTKGEHAPVLYEPSPEFVLESLLPRLLEIRLWQALLETKASEHSSRMIAMRNATTNAGDLLDELTFSYNQARQAAITQEVAEIASAAEAA
jgi:F-type H+-transporting ATPase subunit gamma